MRQIIHCKNYLKFLSQLRGVALRVNLQHLLIGECKLVNRDGGLSAQTGLKDGIVDKHVLLLRDSRQRGGEGKRKVNLQSHANALMRLPTINCTLVKNNAEFNYSCWMWTNGYSRRVFFTSPCPHCLRAENCIEMRWWREKRITEITHQRWKKIKSEKKQKTTTHTEYSKKNTMSWAIN